jgi:hypothetical protein
MTYSSLEITAWILVAVTIERIIAVYKPHEVTEYCNMILSTIVIAGLFIFVLSINSHAFLSLNHMPIFVDKITKICKSCPMSEDYEDFFLTTWILVDFILYTFFPSIIIIIGISVGISIGISNGISIGIFTHQSIPT